MTTEQENFWQSDFGNDYTARNINLVENNYQMFCKIFKYTDDCNDFWMEFKEKDFRDISSVIEFGAGSGQNIQALQRIFPDAEYTAVEINSKAVDELKKINNLEVYQASIIDDWNEACLYDLVLSKGLLIHIYPDNIQKAYDVLYNASNKYILLCEYYSPQRREILYRGEHNKLWAFDFVQSMLDRGCQILDYGFVSKYDKYPQDDLHYFLFNKE